MTEHTMNDIEVEKLIQDEGLEAPRLTPALIDSKIKHKEYVEFITKEGSVLTWCIITLKNGFTVVGEPSACVSIENNNEKVGKQVSYNNSFHKIWALERYLLKEELFCCE